MVETSFVLWYRGGRFNPWSGSWDPSCLERLESQGIEQKQCFATGSMGTLKVAHVKENEKSVLLTHL